MIVLLYDIYARNWGLGKGSAPAGRTKAPLSFIKQECQTVLVDSFRGCRSHYGQDGNGGRLEVSLMSDRLWTVPLGSLV